MTNAQVAKSLGIAQASRRSIVQMCHTAKAAHVGSSLSCTDILAVLYGGEARVDPRNAEMPNRDIVLVSKGHAAAAVYAVLSHAGFFPRDWLDTYCDNGGVLGGHVTSHGVPGVELSTGSLGHALPYAVGVAIGAARDSSSRRVFVVTSDGELDEGSNWEAAMLASHHRLSNLLVIVDRNGLQSLTTTEKTVALEPLALKWEAFGWTVRNVDGHSHEALRAAIGAPSSRPVVIIAETVKGRGVSFMENQVVWHYRPPSSDDVSTALDEIGGRSDA